MSRLADLAKHLVTPDAAVATGWPKVRDTCNNLVECLMQRGAPRFYKTKFATGDAYVGSDRGELQANATFLTNPVFYTSADQQAHVIFTSDNYVKIEKVPGGSRTTIKDWKENERPK